MVLKKSKIKTPYIRLNFRIVRQSDARWYERTAALAEHPVDILRSTVKTLALNTDTLILLARKYYSNKILIRTIDIILEEKYETA